MSKDNQSDVKIYFECDNCKEQLTDCKRLPCGLLLCNICSSSSPSNQKRLKCNLCNTFHSINNESDSTNNTNMLNEEQTLLLKDIEDKFKKFEFDLTDDDSIIKDYCMELRKQVHIATEIRIQLESLEINSKLDKSENVSRQNERN